MRRLLGWTAAAAGAGLAGGLWWWRTHPSACPYSQRLFVSVPHPLITRRRLRDVLAPRAGERILEIGPGTGYYTLDLARWVAPGGRVDIFDLQQEMLDHTMRRVRKTGLAVPVCPQQGDARALPYPDASFDAAVMVTVLGEIPDQRAALAEVRRVLKPSGRLVVGEIAFDPHLVTRGALERRAAAAGLRLDARSGSALGYFAALRPADADAATTTTGPSNPRQSTR
jgi:ubiquinone/menaquinone biosynthesis C-methylase UbiE